MLRIVTDTGSDITYLGAPALGLESLELSVQFEDFQYDYRNDTDFSVFYENLAKAKNLPTTSQVTPGQYLEVFEEAKTAGDEVLVITISGAISGTYASATMAKEECGYDGVTIVDSRRATISQRMIADYAVKLRGEGKSRTEIAEILEQIKEEVVLLVQLDTLKYLKKGGRIPATTAIIGEVLNMKPRVTMVDGKVTPIGKSRGDTAGKQALWNLFAEDGYDPNYPVYFGYTYNKARGQAFMDETKAKFGLTNCVLCSVGGVIGAYGGANCIAMAYKTSKKR
ncbi:MAG: DegV family protein [Oscillospiraceae bacterium]|nr:DegV family protein [Oscillospiraceae bacterium]